MNIHRLFTVGTIIVSLSVAPFAFAQQAKSKKEIEALQAIQTAADNDARMQAVENLLTKFADTQFKGLVLEIALDAALRKNDSVTATIYCERILAYAPDNLNALATLAKLTADQIGENDLDKDDKIKKAQEYANKTLEKVGTAANPYPQVNPADRWELQKKEYAADAHSALAATFVVGKKPEKALPEYQASLEARKDPATMVRIGQVYFLLKNYDQSIAMLDQVINLPDVNPVVKQYAGREKVKAVMEKSKQPKPAAPAAEAPKPQQ